MAKKTILAIVAIYVVFMILDILINGFLLGAIFYESTASLWRPKEEVHIVLSFLVSLIYVICFVSIYVLMIKEKSFQSGLKFGTLFGLAAGITMGFGSYVFLPIPLLLATGWFFALLIKLIAAGALAGLIIKPKRRVL